MTKIEFGNVLAVIAKLWPKHAKEMNDEQANVWWMRLSRHSEADAISALRSHAANSKWMPKPNEIADRIGKGKINASQPAQASGKWDAQKELWAQAAPHRRQEIMSWPDKHCEAAIARWSFVKSSEMYGPTSNYTKRAWELLQYAIQEDEPGVVLGMDYEKDGGLNEANAIYNSHMGANNVRALQEHRSTNISPSRVEPKQPERCFDSPFHPGAFECADDRRGDPSGSDDGRGPDVSGQVETREADPVPHERDNFKRDETDIPW